MPTEFVPNFRLYEDDGVTLVYEFEKVTNIEGDQNDSVSFVEHTSFRGQGSHVSEGSEISEDIVIEFFLLGDNYTDLIEQMEDLKTSVLKFTPYILKIDQDISTTNDYNVKRVVSFQFPIETNNKRRTYQKVIATFKNNCWA